MEDLESAEDVETNMLSLFGSDYQDSGSEYCPSEADQNSASSLTNLEDVLQEGLQSSRLQEDRITGKPKKRIRKTENWARNVKKSKLLARDSKTNESAHTSSLTRRSARVRARAAPPPPLTASDASTVR
ncbi:hypothetical protein SFRURICE_013205 [Spodoptera frugiperda]|nr:hypothetical protein SFRURICE_013205 [Spodoptera frugiperda]